MNLHRLDQFDRAAGAVGSALEEVGGPLGIVGRVIGMGIDEIEAGVPGWAWFGAGLFTGVGAAYVYRERLERLFGD